ncbi:MAG: DNA cytosine methyltransferase [Nostoc sp. CmiVER01]|uniref:DNA cytosine methyltransferase n=1 Tax=Nostoc sp. CmiVER01 TaxID=3075384 RepID=UPI003D1612E8
MFTLENVPHYQESESFAAILETLESYRYLINYSVVNMADFGLPQARPAVSSDCKSRFCCFTTIHI